MQARPSLARKDRAGSCLTPHCTAALLCHASMPSPKSRNRISVPHPQNLAPWCIAFGDARQLYCDPRSCCMSIRNRVGSSSRCRFHACSEQKSRQLRAPLQLASTTTVCWDWGGGVSSCRDSCVHRCSLPPQLMYAGISTHLVCSCRDSCVHRCSLPGSIHPSIHACIHPSQQAPSTLSVAPLRDAA